MRARVVRDPIYGYIEIPARLAQIVDSPMYQRLRRVAQTSLSSLVYPSATGTRFEHGLGAMYLAGRAWGFAWGNSESRVQDRFIKELSSQVRELPTSDRDELVEEIRLATMGAALLHDLGHPPYSHALEHVYKFRARELLIDSPDVADEASRSDLVFHEYAGEYILDHHLSQVLGADATLKNALVAIYRSDPQGTSPKEVLHGIIAGELDIDRLDYLLRDGRKTGTEFGSIDWERYTAGLEIKFYEGGFRVAPKMSARSAVETMLVQRTQSYRWITFHHRIVASNLALESAVESVFNLARDDTTLMTIKGKLVSPEALLKPVIPNLNYLKPGSESLSLLAHSVSSGGGDSDVLAGGEILDVSPNLELTMAASVDDTLIVSMLLGSRVLLGGCVDQAEIPAGTRREMQRLVTFVETALLRKKNVIPLWKTESQFIDWAAQTGEELGEAVSAVFDTLDKDRGEGLRKGLEETLGTRIGNPSRSGSAVLFNWCGEGILKTRVQRARFEARLDSACPDVGGLPGYWRIAATPFSALAHGRKAGIVWDERGNPLKLDLASAILAALPEVERQRNQFAFFYFLVYPGHTADWDQDRLKDARYLLAGHLRTQFPAFVEEELPAALEAKRKE